MLSADARRALARVYAAAVALYGMALLMADFLIDVSAGISGGARFGAPIIAIAGFSMLLLALAIWRELMPAMIAAPLAGIIAWLALGRPTIFLGAIIVIPLIFGLLTALCLWPGVKRN
jgi:hypothetical protein